MNRFIKISPVIILLAAAISARFAPGLPPNFSPVGAMGLYAGVFLPLPYSLGLSLAGLFLSDIALGLYNPLTMSFVYIGMASNALIGLFLARRRTTSSRFSILLAAILGAFLFFLLSNFGVWLSGELYPRTMGGLIACYTAAIPFFGNTLGSQLFFAVFFFGLHQFLSRSLSYAERISPPQF